MFYFLNPRFVSVLSFYRAIYRLLFCLISVLVTIVYSLVSIIIPLLVMGTCYALIARVLRKSSTKFKHNSTAAGNKTRASEIRIVQSTVILSCIYLFCWTYLSVVQFGNMFFNVPSYPHYHVAVALVILNSCINPYVYCIRYDDFQYRLKEMFGFLTCKNK